MIRIREYRDADAGQVGQLIADTYCPYNLDFASAAQQVKLLGPFAHAQSTAPAHRAAIAAAIRADLVLVAEDGGRVVGVLRGRPGRLLSLFVERSHHRQGVGRLLVEDFEADCRRRGASQVTLAASLYAVPFYLAVGYRRSTGVRNGRSFGIPGLRHQPMKKCLATPPGAAD